jgi:hypothetical protein
MAKTTERVSGLLKRDMSVGTILFLLALVPRALGLNVFLTTDEPIWIRQSLNFFIGLLERDYAKTFHYAQPGVTTMWSGVIGLWAKYLLTAPKGSGGLAEFLKAVPAQPVAVDYLSFVRLPTALLTSLCVVGVYFFVKKLFNPQIALLSALLLAFDPYYLAHSRLIHQDALVASFMILSVLSFLIYLGQGRSWPYLVFSALMAGLSFLTKSPALFLGAYLGLLILAGYWPYLRYRPAVQGRKIASDVWVLAVWGLIACALVILLWPVMWVDPIGTISRVLGEALSLASQVHGKSNFFMGQPVSDPGLLFYPVVTLFKLTPLTLGGLLAFIGFWLRKWGISVQKVAPAECPEAKRKGVSKPSGFWKSVLCLRKPLGFDTLLHWRSEATQPAFTERRGKCQNQSLAAQQLHSLALVAFVLSFTAMISLGADKGDRYNLPIFPALDILAAIGLCDLARQIKFLVSRRLPSAKRSPGASLRVVGLLLVLTLQAGLTLAHYPYYLSYFNPLLGGGRQAVKTIIVGWGNGLDEAARYLNSKDNATELRAASWYDGSFAPFFVGQSWPLSKRNLYWQDVDYAVLYLNGVQRLLPNPDIVGYFRSLEPEHTTRFRGLEYAWVYKVPSPLPDVLLPIQHVQRVELGDQILFLGYDLEDERLQSEGKLEITLYWQALRSMAEDYTVYLKLVNSVYHIWGEQEGRPFYDGMPTNAWQAGQKVKDRRELEVLPGTPPGLYHIEVILHDPYRDQALALKDGGGLLLGPVEIPRREPPTSTSLDIAHPQEAILDDKVRLLGYNIESGFRPGDGIHLTVFWQCLEEMEQDYTVFTHLIDGGQNIWGQKDNQPVDGFHPTSRWKAGEVIRDQYDLVISPDAPPGQYWLEVGMYLVETGKRLSVSREGQRIEDSILLGPITIESQGDG